MPIEDLRPSFTREVARKADELELLTLIVAAGHLPASTSLFREVCRLEAAADRLHGTVERELSIRLHEQERRRLQAEAVTT